MPRPSRRYSKRVQVWSYIANPDGFGGNTTSDTLEGTVWAEIRTIPLDKLNEFGLDQNQKNIRIFVRKNADIDYHQSNLFVKFGGIDYTITQVTEIDLDGVEFELLASA